jgi:ubiquinone/menaquinone biosynthesis C-methylase UbiE
MSYLYLRYFFPKFTSYLRKSLVLDVGCGKGSLGAVLKTLAGRQIEAETVGLDLDRGLLEIAKDFLDHVVLGSAVAPPFRDKCFNVSFAIEVLEHLIKIQGYSIISEMERVTAKLIVMTTPSHLIQPDTTEGEFMKHLSLWKTKDFRSLGYVIEGLYPARSWIPPAIAESFPYFACAILAYKVLELEN